MIQQHGGNIEQLENVLDFSANINPLGMPESVKKAITASIPDIEKYPDPYCTELIRKISAKEKISEESIVCGNGADDLIFRIVHAIKPKKALVCAPSFTEYSRALAEVGCETTEYQLSCDNGFELTEEFASRPDSSYDICFVCTPNNPTGLLTAPEVLHKLSDKCRENGVILVCDECFLDFVRNGAEYSMRKFINETTVILKAFTKIYAVPSIRLGYAVFGSTELADRVRDSGQFWSVSSIAQSAGIAALEEKGYLERTAGYVADERSFLLGELADMGVNAYESAANFILFRSRTNLAEMLLAQNILIRDCSGFSGLTEGYYRIAVRTHEENILLTEALRRCLNG